MATTVGSKRQVGEIVQVGIEKEQCMDVRLV